MSSNAATLSDHVGEIALHELQVAIVLQAFLELVRREQVIEVARLRRVRQDSAAASTSRPGRPCRSRRSRRAAGRCGSLRSTDRCAATPRSNAVDGEHVLLGGLLGRIELRVGVRNGEIGFLHGRVEHVAAAQLEPRRERLRVALLGGVRPAGAEQRLVRLRAFQAHALQHRLRLGGAIRLQPREAEREIRLVAQRRELLGRRVDLTDRVEQLRRVVERVPCAPARRRC